jgi:outer membrane receptor protein involved in Fe transport
MDKYPVLHKRNCSSDFILIRSICFMFFLFAFCSFPGMTQSVTDTIHIREVEIIGIERIPVALNSVSEIDSFILNQNLSINLAELLNQHSTVYIKSTGRGSLATASFRGTDASHTKIYWNGLNLNSPMLGQMDLSLIPATFLDHVSLYHGGSSLGTASGAFGGIINLENQPNWNDKNNFSISNELASFRTYQAFGNLHLTKNNWISNSRAFFNHSENDYPYYNTNVLPHETQRLKNGEYSKYGYLQELYYRIRTDDFLSVKLWLQHSDRNLPPPLSRENSKTEESQTDGNIRSVLTWKHYGRSGDVELSSGITSDRINYIAEDSWQENINLDSRSKENSFINRFNYSLQINPKTIAQVQLLYNYCNVEIEEIIHSQGYDAVRSELSMMAGINRNIGKRLSSFFLIRTNLVDKDFIPVMPSLGLALKLLPDKNLYLKSNFSRNYNIPGLNDLYWIPGGNPNLKPEENYTADLALEMQVQNDLFLIHSSITGYLSRINDWIIWKPTQYQYWAPENVALVFSRGIEFSLNTRMDIHDTKIVFQFNYNLNRTTDDSEQLIYIPVHAFNMYSGIQYKGYQLFYSLNYTGKRYTQTANEEENPASVLDSYFLNDISLSKEMNIEKARLNLRFAIYNLFNNDYQVILARPMPGRNYSVILTLSF